MRNQALMLVLLLSGCGDDGTQVTADAAAASDAATATDAPESPADAAPGAFVLTSTAFADGGRFPDAHTCGGANVSPPLAWTAGATGTMSYAYVFTDTNNSLIHSVIWDIPANVQMLPENVEKVYEPSVPAGAKQTTAYNPSTRGYLGPCPGSEHTYVFELFAVDVATLPGVGMSSSRSQVAAALAEHTVETTTLTGTWGP